MELTQTYKTKATSTSPRHTLRQFVLTFANRHANVFESLSRAATPFGSSWLPAGEYATNTTGDHKVLLKRLTLMQEQLRHLHQQVNLLRDELSGFHQSSRNESALNRATRLTNQVGIHRFKALQAKS